MNELNKTRRLVFHFYVPENWKESSVVKIHIACLKYYANVFDEAIFIISVDETDNQELISEFESTLIKNFKCSNITFKIRKNNDFRETKTLYDEVMLKLGDLDGLTFFGHSKGIGNERYIHIDMKDISYWIIGLYYFSLSRIWEVELTLYDIKGITYGPFKTYSEKMFDNRHNWIYSGTFFWINTKKLKYKIEHTENKPRDCYDRFYSELIIGDILPFHNTDLIAHDEAVSFNNSYISGEYINYYEKIEEYIAISTAESEKNKFNNFYDKILEECGISYQ